MVIIKCVTSIEKKDIETNELAYKNQPFVSIN